MKKLIFLLGLPLLAQTPNLNTYGAFIQGTSATLALPVGLTDTSITVQNGSCFSYTINTPCNTAFVSNQIINIDGETMQICSVAVGAGQTTILNLGHASCPNIDGRGFGGTQIESHFSNVTSFITTYSYNQILASLSNTTNIISYGARGDNTTDNTPFINKAIQDLSSKGGGTIYFPSASGCYMAGFIIPSSNITFQGANNSVCIKQLPQVTSQPLFGYVSGVYNEIQNENFYSLTIDGNRQNQPGTAQNSDCIFIYGGSGSILRDVIIQNCATDGIYITGYTQFQTSGGSNINLSHVLVNNSSRNGLSIICTQGVNITDSSFNNANGQNPQSGIDIENNGAGSGTQYTQNVHISNSIFNSNAHTCINYYEQFNSQLNSGMIFSNITCVNSGSYGVVVETFNSSYKIGGVTVNGTFYNNGTSGPGNYSVLLDSNVINSIISGNMNETNAGTVPFSFGGTGIIIGPGYYNGPTYSGCVVAGGSGYTDSAAYFTKGFNPTCTGTLYGTYPQNLTVNGTLNLGNVPISNTSGALNMGGRIGIGMTPSLSPFTWGQLLTTGTGVNNAVSMWTMGLYTTGTVTIAASNTNVTGSGTVWEFSASSYLVGGNLTIGGVLCGTIASVQSNTALTLSGGSSCPSAVNASYAIYPATGFYWAVTDNGVNFDPELNLFVYYVTGSALTSANVLTIGSNGFVTFSSGHN